ncbi:MAG TPA: sulfatase-like hydrolase/transferase [Solirubrobacteraceae bacterium]|nr:sulfatase-like hydrolase/transferase [Solirubrobacteraceae bacterium]
MSDEHLRRGDERLDPGEVDRRRFMKTMGAAAAGGILAELGVFEQMAGGATGPAGGRSRRPNIIFLMVDEMRFPSVFPHGVRTPEQFLERFMPNLHVLWRHGVKFTNHHTAGVACSPARASLVTGLYPHQQWLLQTRAGRLAPSLQTALPTYGKLLRSLGYRTPYVGKWHLSNTPLRGAKSNPCASEHTSGYLEEYGFTGMTNPDPWGHNGEGAQKDGDPIANQAICWLAHHSSARQPYCLTVSFVNPHDRQYFWAGTEGTAYEALFAGQSLKPFIDDYTSIPGEDDPPSYGYAALPPNWESAARLRQHKPSTQTLFRQSQAAVWGGASDSPAATGFAIEPFPGAPDTYGLGIAPFSYWRRGMDAYTYAMTLIDQQIGRVVASVPRSQLRNTVFVFASDHGDFSGAHGFLNGKMGTGYREAYHVPLIVADPSGRLTAHQELPRHQLTSSVDVTPFLASLGNGGSRSWMRGDLRRMYGHRLDLVPLLRNPRATGRDHLLFATDEIPPTGINYLRAPYHILGVQTDTAKLVTYSHWAPRTATLIARGMEIEFYDYATAAGRAELDSTPEDPRARALLRKLLGQYLAQEMQAPLPTPALRAAARRAQKAYLNWVTVVNAYGLTQLIQQHKLRDVLGWGLTV